MSRWAAQGAAAYTPSHTCKAARGAWAPAPVPTGCSTKTRPWRRKAQARCCAGSAAPLWLGPCAIPCRPSPLPRPPQVVMLIYRLFGGSVNQGVPGQGGNMFDYHGPRGLKVRGQGPQDLARACRARRPRRPPGRLGAGPALCWPASPLVRSSWACGPPTASSQGPYPPCPTAKSAPLPPRTHVCPSLSASASTIASCVRRPSGRSAACCWIPRWPPPSGRDTCGARTWLWVSRPARPRAARRVAKHLRAAGGAPPEGCRTRRPGECAATARKREGERQGGWPRRQGRPGVWRGAGLGRTQGQGDTDGPAMGCW